MILSITDGIEVAEHTEPQERAEFCAEYKAAQLPCFEKIVYPGAVFDSAPCALMARQAE